MTKRMIGPKYYYEQNNIGKAKYTVSYHDGIQTHKDGSNFYGMKIFKNKKKRKEGRGVIHDFSVGWEEAWKYFDLGFLISFNGNITFPPKKSQPELGRQREELIRKIPLDKFMIETDSPFLSPIPHRGERNEPISVKYVVDQISQIKKVAYAKIAKATTGNAKRLFKI